MGSGSYMQLEVKCPFYKYDDGRFRITCEGILDESSLAMIFHKKADFETQMRVFCWEHYPKCEIHRMLMENKYPEELENQGF